MGIVLNPFTGMFDITGGAGGVPTYTTFSALPAGAPNGTLAVTLDTNVLYMSNGTIWQPIATPGDALSVGAFGSTPNSNGQIIISNALSMQPADATHPGAVSTITQSFGGDKTFTGTISASNLSGTNTGDVTLGTADGLSLSGQVLSLGTSSTSTTGALNSTDWNTFNNKQPAGNYITSLTGGVIASGPGAAAATVITNANLTGDVTSVGNASTLVATTNGTLTTLSSLSLPATQLTGTLPAARMPALTGDVTSTVNTTTTSIAGTVVTGKLLTGYTSGAGTVSASDSILQGIQKLNGNDALKLPLAGGTMSGVINMGSNKISGLSNGTLTNDAVNYGQLSSLIGGLNYDTNGPVAVPNMISDALTTPPGSPVNAASYLAASGASGGWTAGHVYEYNSASVSWVDVLGRAVIIGDRFGINFESLSPSLGGNFTSNASNIATITNATPGSYAYTFTTPTAKLAVYIYGTEAQDISHLYYYNSGWVDLLGAATVRPKDGNALAYTGNILNVQYDGTTIDLNGSNQLEVKASGINTTQLANNAVTLAKLATSGITDGITLDQSGAGNTFEIKTSGVGTTQIASAAVTFAKMANLAANSVIGNNSGSATQPAALPLGTLTELTSSVLTLTGFTNATIGSPTIQVTKSSTIASGYLSSTDWNTFNNKQNSLTFGNLTDAGTDGITVTNGTGAVIGSGTSISQQVADTTHNGYLSSTDWNTFNSKASKSAGDIAETNFSIANNQSAATNVTGLAFANATVRSFEAQVSVFINATTPLYEMFTVRGIQKAASWDLSYTSLGDSSGVVFSITTAGQIQYKNHRWYSTFAPADDKNSCSVGSNPR